MSGGDINKECMMLQDFFKMAIQIQKDKPRKPKNKTKQFKVKRKPKNKTKQFKVKRKHK